MIHDIQILKSLNTNTWQRVNELPQIASSSQFIFPLVPWETDVKVKARKQTLQLYSHAQANTQADRQAITCVHKHNWKGERQSSSSHPGAWDFYYAWDSTPCFALQIILVAGVCAFVAACVFSHASVCVWMFLCRWHECLFWWIPVCLVHCQRWHPWLRYAFFKIG